MGGASLRVCLGSEGICNSEKNKMLARHFDLPLHEGCTLCDVFGGINEMQLGVPTLTAFDGTRAACKPVTLCSWKQTCLWYEGRGWRSSCIDPQVTCVYADWGLKWEFLQIHHISKSFKPKSACTHTTQHVCGGQRFSHFSHWAAYSQLPGPRASGRFSCFHTPSPIGGQLRVTESDFEMQVPGSELRPSGLRASTFYLLRHLTSPQDFTSLGGFLIGFCACFLLFCSYHLMSTPKACCSWVILRVSAFLHSHRPWDTLWKEQSPVCFLFPAWWLTLTCPWPHLTPEPQYICSADKPDQLYRRGEQPTAEDSGWRKGWLPRS